MKLKQGRIAYDLKKKKKIKVNIFLNKKYFNFLKEKKVYILLFIIF